MELSGQSIPLEEFYALTVYIGKLILLGNLLEKVFQVRIHGTHCTIMFIFEQTTEEKFVIVSHYTSTLDVIEAFCKQMRYTYSRLDG